MPDFKRLFFSTPTPSEADTGEKTPAPLTFTEEQTATMCAALNLDPDVTADEFVAKFLALVESADEVVAKATENNVAASLNEDEVQRIAASAAKEVLASVNTNDAVIIDRNAWTDMKKAMDVGIKAERQQHRLAAEQVVDQAIRRGKASPFQREHWIDAYNADKEKTMRALNAAKEIPRVEIGHSLSIEQLDAIERNSWVR
ncbi:hypothetical protein ACOJA0_09820 [Corynebacterium amycolatum]|uniref:hypothetical protein n=1 Tax=Corynebacterium amycolatum TaxID=43765 RepID=UPI003B5A4DAD